MLPRYKGRMNEWYLGRAGGLGLPTDATKLVDEGVRLFPMCGRWGRNVRSSSALGSGPPLLRVSLPKCAKGGAGACSCPAPCSLTTYHSMLGVLSCFTNEGRYKGTTKDECL